MHRLQHIVSHLCSVPAAANGRNSLHEGRLKGKVAIVTGAASGIGRAASIIFAEQGASVVCADISEAGAKQTAAIISDAGGCAKAFQIDVAIEDASKQLIDGCVSESGFGRLDIFFANAGVIGNTNNFWDAEMDEWARVLHVNTIGVAMGFKHAFLYMREHGVRGSLIATSSVAGLRSGAGPSPYSASKAAVISLVQTVANQLAGTGIRCNAICPGLIETGMTSPIFQYAKSRGTENKLGQLNPLRRTGEPDEIANVALFLASDESSYVNGQAITACGGLSSSHPFRGK